GGGIYCTSSTMTVTNCTFYGNDSGSGGGAAQNSNSSNLNFGNCIFWANTSSSGSEIINISLSTLTVNYSLMQTAHGGTGNIDGQNPLFVDEMDLDGVDDIFGTTDDGLQLLLCSPAVDAGEDIATNPNVPLTDILGNVRIATTDIGAYEYDLATSVPLAPIYVNITAMGNNDGRSWTDAYTDLQDAIDYACEGREIWVAQGVYHPTRIPMDATASNSLFTDRDFTFHLDKDMEIYGGFVGTETLLSQRDHSTNLTILSGDIGTVGDISDNCYHVFITARLSSAAVLDGFLVTGGNSSNTSGSVDYEFDTFDRRNGGGLYNVASSPSMVNCSLYANTAGNGGGLCNEYSSPSMINCNLYTNTANRGSGMYNDDSSPSMVDCNLYANTGANHGGGIYNKFLSSPSMVNCSLYTNTADYGGGMYNEYSSPSMVNCNLYTNTVTIRGGGVYNDDSSPSMINCNLYANVANSRGGGVYNKDNDTSSPPIIVNCIFWKNEKGGSTTVLGADIESNSGFGGGVVNPIVSHSLLQVYSNGTDNIVGQNPLFVDESDLDGADNIPGTADDGLTLQPCSPAVNMADNSAVNETDDIANQVRIYNGIVDMGAYEYQNDTLLDATNITMTAVAYIQNQGATTYYGICNELVAKVEQNGASPISGITTTRVWMDGSVQSYNGKPYVTRHYEITPDNNASTAMGRVTLYFTQNEFNAYNTSVGTFSSLPTTSTDMGGISNLRITKFGGTSFDNTGNPGTYSGNVTLIDPDDTDIIWNNVMSRWEVSFDVTGFSGFFAHTGGTPLPVELLDFSGQADGADNRLSWTTASETDNQGFYVEHSTDGQGFQKIGWVDGHGTTVEEMDYGFLHRNPMSSINYYRLEQLDYDGTSEYSKVISIRNGSKESMMVFPNPTSDIVKIRTEERNRSLRVTDMTGNILQTYDYVPERITLESLPSGIYTIRVGTEAIIVVKESSD
ncbi:MAG: choice-of-anchor Q domain-containing protein, partial [Saprospiraceae bacterium]